MFALLWSQAHTVAPVSAYFCSLWCRVDSDVKMCDGTETELFFAVLHMSLHTSSCDVSVMFEWLTSVSWLEFKMNFWSIVGTVMRYFVMMEMQFVLVFFPGRSKNVHMFGLDESPSLCSTSSETAVMCYRFKNEMEQKLDTQLCPCMLDCMYGISLEYPACGFVFARLQPRGEL